MDRAQWLHEQFQPFSTAQYILKTKKKQIFKQHKTQSNKKGKLL